MFKGLLRMITKHQDQLMILRLRGKFVQIDPRVWNSDMDVEVNVALSATSTEEKMAMLGQISAKQEQILQTLGLANPLVSLGQYRNTLAKMIEMAGFRDAAAFFNEVPADYQPPQPEQKQTPEEMLAMVQAQSIQADIQKKAAELQLEREKMLRSDDRERDRIEADVALRARELELKYQQAVDTAQITALMERDREAMRQQAAMQQAAMQPPPQPMN
jgi:hypothetical protein